MNRTILLFALIAVFSTAFISCDDPLGVNNCNNVGLLLDVTYEVDPDNELLVNFQLVYGGNHTVSDDIDWDFGDGTTMTISGRAATHTYDAKGTYTVSARLVLTGDDIGECTKEPSQIVAL